MDLYNILVEWTLKKIKISKIFLLFTYAAIFIPCVTGQVLCIGCSDSEYETGPIQDCCCHNEQGPITRHCTPETPSESTLSQSAACTSNPCLCIDVPLDTSNPHYVSRNVNQAPLLFEAPTMLSAVVLSENFGTPYKTISPLPGDINNLHTIILLI